MSRAKRAADRLYLAGELEAALPLDDAEILDASKPVGEDGVVDFDAAAIETRERAIARRLVDHGPGAMLSLA